MPEQLVWFIFECLALGAYAIEYGTEDESKPKWDKNIMHCDLKPENCESTPLQCRLPSDLPLVFLGTNDKDHTKTPIVKVCLTDFRHFGTNSKPDSRFRHIQRHESADQPNSIKNKSYQPDGDARLFYTCESSLSYTFTAHVLTIRRSKYTTTQRAPKAISSN